MRRLPSLLILTCLLGLLSGPKVVAHEAGAPPRDPLAGHPLRGGPMLGYSEPTETVVWLQTTRPALAQLRFWPQGDAEKARLSEAIETRDAGDLIARFVIRDLEFGTTYDYVLYLDGRRVPLPYTTRFQSQPMWKWRTDPPDLRAAIGSCLYVNEPPFDRPGKPYGGGFEILGKILETDPDLMLWLGDNVYLREADWTGEAGIRHRYAHTRSLPQLQPLLASVHHYAIWDDHDYGPNNSDRSYRGREASLRVFADYWANHTYGTLETPGVFGRFEWGDVEFFLLDDRFHRSPNHYPPGPERRMFGRAQLQWLKESLASSGTTFKVIVGGNQLLNPLTFHEALGNFEEEQRELLDFLREAKIEGVVFLSGDRHHTELIKIREPGMYPLFEFTSSPLTAGGSRLEKEENNPARVAGTWITDGRRNFGILEVTGPSGKRVMTLRAYDGEGREVWNHRISEGELAFTDKDD